MKKIYIALLSALFIFNLAPNNISVANAQEQVIYLTSKTHQMASGIFRDDTLAEDLLSTGKLGKAIGLTREGPRTWIIDGALLDEVAAMADGYELLSKEDSVGRLAAKEWLSRLKLVTSGDQIIALPYGNPDKVLTKKYAPGELRFYSAFGIERVVFHLNRQISTENGLLWSKGRSRLNQELRAKYTESRQKITALSSVINSEEIRAQRAKLATLLSPKLNRVDREFFTQDASDGVVETLAKLRVTSGNYQIASEKGDLPISVINEFDLPVLVNIQLTPLNSRVQLAEIATLELAANSRTQLDVPFNVIAPGSTIVLAQIQNLKGSQIGPEAKLTINVNVFDSRVTWFTIGAAILLFGAALTQTIRRIRRGRHEK